MLRAKSIFCLCTALLLSGLPAASLSAETPQSVSPGSTDQVALLSTNCPTFSWALIAGAKSYELLVYRLGDEISSPASAPTLRLKVPGGATTWTPSADSCFAPGDRYMWVVRALIGGKPSSWSEARMFEVSTVPSAEELRQAILVLERFKQNQNLGIQESFEADGREARTQTSIGKATPPERPTPPQGVSLTGTAAIRGNQTDSSGETLGVVGEAASPDGVGVAAANTGGGADLLLDGSADAETDTVVSQSAIDRSSSNAETFEIKNSGGGGMTVLIDGVATVTTATDSDTLGALACASDQIAQWNGSSWVCVAVQGGDTLAGLSCTDSQVVHWNGSAWVCGQPSLLFETCSGSLNCLMSCPASSIVWTGGCETTSGNPASISESRPTSGGAGQPPTGWECSAVNPIGPANVTGYLYCVSQ